MILPFVVALASVGVFSLFAYLATVYRERSSSRLLMWAGIILFLGGCYLFGVLVTGLCDFLLIAAVIFFAVLFSLSAAYFIRRRRKTRD